MSSVIAQEMHDGLTLGMAIVPLLVQSSYRRLRTCLQTTCDSTTSGSIATSEPGALDTVTYTIAIFFLYHVTMAVTERDTFTTMTVRV